MKPTRPLLSVVSLFVVVAFGTVHLLAEDTTSASGNKKKLRFGEFYYRGLDWLQKQQNTNGSWGSERPLLLTGYALASYVSQGESGEGVRYGETVKAALSWLVELSKHNDGRLCSGKEFTPQGRIEHAICSYALSEYFLLSGDERVKPALASAVQHIIASQNDDGGWKCGIKKSDDDFRLTGWNCTALASVDYTKLKLPNVRKCLDAASKWFVTKERDDGSYRHIQPTKAPSDPWRITGISIFARLLWSENTPDISRSMRWLINEAEKHPLKYKEAGVDLEVCFFSTQATLMFGGSAWERWNRLYIDKIENAQTEDGSWPVPGGKFPGLQSETTKDGAIYRTAICLKMFPPLGRNLPRIRDPH